MLKNNKLSLTLIVWLLYTIWLTNFAGSTLTIMNVLSYVLFLSLFIFLYFKDFKLYFKDFSKKKRKNFITLIIVLISLFGLALLSNIIILIIETLLGKAISADSSNSIMKSLFFNIPFGTIFSCFITIVFSPIVEDLVFKKSLRDIIKNPVIFVILSSLLIWYFQVTLLNPHFSEFVSSIYVFLCNIFLSILFVKKDNLLFSTLPRIGYNLIICSIQIILLLSV